MLSKYFHRQLIILPPDWEGSANGVINSTAAGGCADNTGNNGTITVTVTGSINAGTALTITLHPVSVASAAVATYAMDTTADNEHTFTGLADGTYVVRIRSNSDATIYRDQTIVLTCEAIAFPPSDMQNDTFILLQADYYGPKTVNVEGVSKWEYNVTVVRFNTITEQPFVQSFVKQVPVLMVQTNYHTQKAPFYAYCVPNTTTRNEWYYTSSKLTKKVVENSAICGFVTIRGCTDETATNYNASATEDDGTCYYRPQVMGCTDPRASNFNPNATDNDGTCSYTPATVEPLFHVPLINSVRFVATENIDGVGVMQTLDNVLHCNEKFQTGFSNQPYYQPVCKGDVHTYQLLSNYGSASLTVHKYPQGNLVATLAPTVKEQFTGDSDFFAGYLKNNTNGQTRIYFNTGDIPAPAGIGDVITIANAVGYNGVYAIVDIKQDVKLQSPYIVINRPYASGDTVVPADIQFNLAVADYDVLEQIVDWSLYPEGLYELRITGTDATHGSITYTSEPVNLRTEHPNTLLIEYRNYDNAFDMVYTTGIVNRLRVAGEMRERLGGGMDEVHREPMNKLTRLRGVAQRRVRMNLWMLPAYLHEKLSVITRHDFIRINGVEYQTEEGYGEPDYNGASLSDSSTVMEQSEWFKAHNDHDLGSINQSPLLIVNGGFLRL